MALKGRIHLPSRTETLRILTSRTGVVAITTLGTLLVRTASSVVLTRLLSPQAFGIVGIVASIFFALTMLTDLGFQSFVVRDERAHDRHFRNVIWTIHAGRGMVLTVIAALASPVVAMALGKPEVALPLAVASATFVLNGAASLSLIVALREDGARKLSLLDFGLQVIQTILSILLALYLRNAWALIAAMVLQAVLRTVASYVLFPSSGQKFARDRSISRDFMAWSRIVLASSSLSLVIGQTDKLVLAKLFTLGQFGLYAIALNIASAPVAFSDAYVTRVLFPAYVQAWRLTPERIGPLYYSIGRAGFLLYAAGCGALVGGASLLIAMLYDPRYANASPYLALLAVGSSLRLPNFAAAELMTAMGQIKTTVHLNVARLAWLVVAIPLGYLYLGTLGVVAAVGLMELPPLLCSWFVLRRAGLLEIHKELLYLSVIAMVATAAYAAAFEVLAFFPKL